MTRVLRLALCLVLVAGVASAQSTSTFNGRVLDQGDAVLPGVTVTVTNQATGVVRTTVSNAEGLYFLPGLDPGTYDIATELPGFAPSTRSGVALGVNATISLDFKMGLAGVNEAVTVTGDAPLIEVTQSKVASSIEATEIQNLPMITRTVSGMLALLPGAAPMAPVHRSKENVGSVSFGGASGTNVIPTVDGADNRDNRYGGALLTFTTESLEQFQLATSQFTAADGRTGGAALTMVTKSGTNQFRGSAFTFTRDDSLTAKDYFTEVGNQDGDPVQPPAVGRLHRRPAPAQPHVLLRRVRGHLRGQLDSGPGQPVRAAGAAPAGDERRPHPAGAGQSGTPACRADPDEPQALHAEGQRAAQ